ncbi:hypothetical protein TrVE_jg302 [Triparma verrucosa]|uniref:Tyrosine-protein kinase ephrin type A/B receptor-like domain-containing protein n=1 Tax=Triparma verrucosa TaxID=1606542 RepID=A0A9W7DPG8_9STRA|nr:hypothetical protein TrVE_jg302 [Triparma verrucosa]
MENDEQGQANGELGLTIVASSSWRSESSDVFYIAKDNVHPEESLHVLNEGLENIILSPKLPTTIPAREIYEVGRGVSRRRAGKAIGPGTQQCSRPISKDDMAWEGGLHQTKEVVTCKNHKGGKCKRTKPDGMCLVVPPKACLISEKQRTHSDGKVVEETHTVSEMHSKSEVVDEARLISERQSVPGKGEADESDSKVVDEARLILEPQSLLSKDKAGKADSKVVDEAGLISETQSMRSKYKAGEADNKVVDETSLISGTQFVPGKGEADESDSKVIDKARLISETQSMLFKDIAGKTDSKVVDETGPISGTQSVPGKGEADEDGTTMKIYKNSALAGTMTDGHEPNVLTRTQHWLGRSAWPDGYFDGTIAYVKMWHGLELTDSDAAFLFSNRELLQFANCELGSGAVSDTVCETCPEGKYSDIDGEGPCTLCPAGRYSDTTGATSCSDCDAGKFSDEGEPSCASCQAGTYVSETTVSLSTCTSCPPGKFSGTAGATSCSECEAGKYTNQGATACVICSYNTFSGSAGQACIACPTGKHISDPGTYPGLGTSADLHDSEDDCVAGNPR